MHGPLAFVVMTSLQDVGGTRLVWYHLTVQNQSDVSQSVQITGALRPYGIEEFGVLRDLAFNTSGLFLREGQVVLHDAVGVLDGIRLSDADCGDVYDMIEGTVPPEGGLSLSDLRERSLQVSCKLGLCCGATTTAADLKPGETHKRWWALPQDPVSAGDWPLHLVQETWSQRLRSQLWEESERTGSDGPMDVAESLVMSFLEESARGEVEFPGLPLPLANDLPVFEAASCLIGRGSLYWSVLSRWMMHQQPHGLLEYGAEDPLAATAAWLYATVTHAKRHPVMAAPRSPFPSDSSWPKALRSAILSLGWEFRRRSKEGWQQFRHQTRLHTGEELAAIARLMVATHQLASLGELMFSREEGVALIRVHGELRQLLAHAVAKTLEHSPRGYLAPGVGIPFSSASLYTLEAISHLPAEDQPCPYATLHATARALYRLAQMNPHGCLLDDNVLPSPGRTYRLALTLRKLGYPNEAQLLADRIQDGAHRPGGGEWPRSFGSFKGFGPPAEDPVVSAAALLMDRGWVIGVS
jgi:hypothetical protein